MNWKDGFERYEAIKGTPAMSITRNGIAFNQATLQRLGKPPFVFLYLDRDKPRFAIEACFEAADGALSFYREGSPLSKGVRWNNADLRLTLEQLMGWDTRKSGYKVVGSFVDDEVPALVFDLATATPLPDRRRK